jgi:hypothetical protein
MHDPILIQVNTRLWLDKLSRELNRQATLDDISDQSLHQLADQGFDWLYLLGIWLTGEKEAELARAEPSLQSEAKRLLGIIGDQAICASCFAISGYDVPENWGGSAALKRLEKRIHRFGLHLMLDFIPNHTGVSHPWALSNPDYFIGADGENDILHKAAYATQTVEGPRYLMHGRDPYFPPWSDTLQLNYANPDLQAAMRAELLKVAAHCDGLRCDMAMLVLPEIFQKNWGKTMPPFWPQALAAVRAKKPDFVFMAEVYWNLETTLINQGFNYAYDKDLYDAFKTQDVGLVNSLIKTRAAVLPHLAHFLENHDEPRAAAVFPFEVHKASALISYGLPGLRFFFEGQLKGHSLRSPIQFCTSPKQPEDEALSRFYGRLTGLLVEMGSEAGEWIRIEPEPASTGDDGWKHFVSFAWQKENGKHWLVVVNFSPYKSQCLLRLPFSDMGGRRFLIKDRMNERAYQRSGDEMSSRGLFIELQAWGYHLFNFLTDEAPKESLTRTDRQSPL